MISYKRILFLILIVLMLTSQVFANPLIIGIGATGAFSLVITGAVIYIMALESAQNPVSVTECDVDISNSDNYVKIELKKDAPFICKYANHYFYSGFLNDNSPITINNGGWITNLVREALSIRPTPLSNQWHLVEINRLDNISYKHLENGTYVNKLLKELNISYGNPAFNYYYHHFSVPITADGKYEIVFKKSDNPINLLDTFDLGNVCHPIVLQDLINDEIPDRSWLKSADIKNFQPNRGRIINNFNELENTNFIIFNNDANTYKVEENNEQIILLNNFKFTESDNLIKMNYDIINEKSVINYANIANPDNLWYGCKINSSGEKYILNMRFDKDGWGWDDSYISHFKIISPTLPVSQPPAPTPTTAPATAQPVTPGCREISDNDFGGIVNAINVDPRVLENTAMSITTKTVNELRNNYANYLLAGYSIEQSVGNVSGGLAVISNVASKEITINGEKCIFEPNKRYGYYQNGGGLPKYMFYITPTGTNYNIYLATMDYSPEQISVPACKELTIIQLRGLFFRNFNDDEKTNILVNNDGYKIHNDVGRLAGADQLLLFGRKVVNSGWDNTTATINNVNISINYTTRIISSNSRQLCNISSNPIIIGKTYLVEAATNKYLAYIKENSWLPNEFYVSKLPEDIDLCILYDNCQSPAPSVAPPPASPAPVAQPAPPTPTLVNAPVSVNGSGVDSDDSGSDDDSSSVVEISPQAVEDRGVYAKIINIIKGALNPELQVQDRSVN